MSDEIIKCLKCGHVLISGKGMAVLFGPGTSIECRKCGNKHIFGNKTPFLADKNKELANE